MRRKLYYGIATTAAIALAIALNTTGPISKTNIVNATEQSINAVKTNDSVLNVKETKSEGKITSKTNKAVPDDKAQTVVPSSKNKNAESKPQIEVPVDLEVEKGDQKNADAGSSPWKLDPIFVSQVFVSLQISPEGIQGDYPVKQEEIKFVKDTEKEAIVQVNSNKTNIKRIYLKRLIKQDSTGIWTVVGYDTMGKR
jgi:hypothetical protein